jgi:hypothetical protein
LAGTPRIILEDNTFTQWEIDNSLGDLRIFNPGLVKGVFTTAGALLLPISGVGAGLLLGGDFRIYRVSANVGRTPHSLVIDGLLGIGVIPTATPFHIFSGTDQKIILAGSGGPYIRWANAAGANLGLIQNNNAGPMVISQDQVQPIQFDTGGNPRWNITGAGNLNPVGAGVLSIGDATTYINDLSHKTLTDRGCLGWFDNGVELRDGRIVSDVEALCLVRPHTNLLTVYGVPQLDYSTMPVVVYKPAPRDDQGNPQGTDGAELTALISIMIGAIKELNTRMVGLETAHMVQ